jgi:hypothetical protein
LSLLDLLIPPTDVASGAHIVNQNKFSIPNDARDMLKEKTKRKKKRDKRLKKIKSFLQNLFVKNSTGLTSIQNSTMMDNPDDPYDQGVVLGLPGNARSEPLPGDAENFPGEFTYPFGFKGGEDQDLPPANNQVDKNIPMGRKDINHILNSTSKAKEILENLLDSLKKIKSNKANEVEDILAKHSHLL